MSTETADISVGCNDDIKASKYETADSATVSFGGIFTIPE